MNPTAPFFVIARSDATPQSPAFGLAEGIGLEIASLRSQ